MDEKFSRQTDLVDCNILKTPISIIGAGGIGSFTTLTLAKMGFNYITIWDDDVVEEHNLPNQFYRNTDIGDKKVYALKNIVEAFTDTKIHPIDSRYTTDALKGVVISAVDNMKTRSILFDNCKRNPNVKSYIDGRMGGNQAEVYTVCPRNLNDKDYYKSILWNDSETSPILCTSRAVIYNVVWIASTIANQVRLVLSRKDYNNALIMDLENMMLHYPK